MGKAKNFLTPDSRKIALCLIIPVFTFAIFVSGPFLFPVGSSAFYAIPQVLLGVFLILVTTPFGVVAMIFGAFGIDFFYSTALIAKTGVILGVLVTVFWWYIISCLAISIYRRFKRRGA